MEIKLEREVVGESYLIQGEVQRQGKENPLIPILVLAEELIQEQGEFYVEDIRDNLLPALPLVGIKNLLARMRSLGLIEWNSDRQSFHLTALGRHAAQHQVMWQPEVGIFQVTWYENPFSDQKIYQISNHKDQSKSDKKENESRPIEIPQKLEHEKGKIIELSKGNSILKTIEAMVIKMENIRLMEKIHISNGQIIVSLHNGSSQETELWSSNISDQYNYESEITHLMNGVEQGKFNYTKMAISVPFNPDDLTFYRDVKLESPQFSNFTYKSTSIARVRHYPANDIEANKWKQELQFKKAIKWFSTMYEYLQFDNEISIDFVSDYQLMPISPQEMAKYSESKPNSFYQRMKFQTFQDLTY